MEVHYRQAFLKDLKRLKRHSIYNEIFELVFTALPNINSLRDISDVKVMKGHINRYRIRRRDYRIGIEVQENIIEIVRVLHRREFYRYFP